MMKICLNAGHGLYTAGKRCLKSLDPNETREWILNSRILSKIVDMLSDYEGYELLRLDDPSGKIDVPLRERTNKANNFKADIYISIHHNAGVNGKTGGGIVAYTYPSVDQNTKDWQKALYDALVAETGLKGNRSTPLATADFHECRETTMAAVLLELGYMDSKTDVPIILSDDFASKCATAITKVIVTRCGLKKKAKPEQNNTDQKILWKVQVGAFSIEDNAKKLKAELESKGYPAFIVRVDQ